jgi:hypothetical protein
MRQRNRSGVALAVVLLASPALAQQTWWTGDDCRHPQSGEIASPAAAYEGYNAAHLVLSSVMPAPELIDKGDEVDVKFCAQEWCILAFYRTEEACREAANEAAAAKAKQDKFLEKYR